MAAKTNFTSVVAKTQLETPLGIFDALKVASVAATAAAGAATANAQSVTVTSESLTTAAGGIYTLTLTNSYVTASSKVFANAYLGTSTQGIPQVVGATPGAGSVVIKVKNIDATLAFNGTIKIDALVVNPK